MEASRIQRYLADLSSIARLEVTQTVCPLCFQECVPTEIAEGHIVPQALGGKRTTLTCRSCDNTLGHRLEGPVISFLLNADRIEGTSPGRPHGVRTWVEFEGQVIFVHVTGNDQGGVSIRAVRSADEPALQPWP